MPNAIVQISKFVCVVTSCEGRPTADVFAHHYELHYQNKKIHLEGSETTFATQFGCISFHLSRFGNHLRLTLITRNKWSSRWDGNLFYCRVPLEQNGDFRGQRTYPLSSKMAKLDYLTKVPSSCGPEYDNFMAFIEATSLIGGHDVVEEFLACGLWPLGQQFSLQVETKEYPLSKVLVQMPQITATIRERESEAKFVVHIEDAANELFADTTLRSITLIKGLGTSGSTIFLSWPEFSDSPAMSPSCGNTNMLPR
jgi:hypothetical protein